MSIDINIRKKLGGFSLDVSFVKNGNCLGILGASGEGKSMTLKCLAGIEKPDHGKIVLNNKVLFDSEKKINLPPQKRNVGYLFQNYALFPKMTVEENIAIGIKERSDKKFVKETVLNKIKEFQLTDLGEKYPTELSGGQQQRVALARIMASSPDVIMLDEPFSALDSYLKEILQEQLLETLKSFSGDIIMVSHSRDEIYKFCDELAVLEKGSIVIMGRTKDIFEKPKRFQAARLTGCKNISPVKKINDYEIYVKNWGIKIKTKTLINDNIKYIGIRAHDILVTDEPINENSFFAELKAVTEAPFEVNCMFTNKKFEESQEIWWKISKAKWQDYSINAEKYLTFPEENLMFLE